MPKKYAFFALSLLLATMTTGGCAHSEKNAARKLEVGMTKADVLELLGNPNHTGRKLNSDVWLYSNSQGVPEKTEIFFVEGKVTYIGDGSLKSSESESGKGFRPVGQ